MLRNSNRNRILVGAVLLVFVSSIASCKREAQPEAQASITVAAAADLGPPFEEIAKSFEQATGTKVVISLGSTGLLEKQIENGAPMDVFAAANLSFVDDLDRKSLILSDTKALYARGRITLWTRSDSNIQVDRIESLTKPEIKRIAIAQPEHAPYGMAAREAMKSAGVWDTLLPKVVYGENIRQTLQFAETGNVEVAIVALSLSVQSKGKWALIPQEMHSPIDQALAVIKGTKHEDQARKFALFINGPIGRPIMRKYGFVLPGETSN